MFLRKYKSVTRSSSVRSTERVNARPNEKQDEDVWFNDVENRSHRFTVEFIRETITDRGNVVSFDAGRLLVFYKAAQAETNAARKKKRKKEGKEKVRRMKKKKLLEENRGKSSLKRVLFPAVIQSWTSLGQLLSRWTDDFLGRFRDSEPERGAKVHDGHESRLPSCTPGWLHRHEFYRRLETQWRLVLNAGGSSCFLISYSLSFPPLPSPRFTCFFCLPLFS